MKRIHATGNVILMAGLGVLLTLATAAPAGAQTATNVVCTGCVASTDIADLGVASADLATGAVTGAKILDGTITAADLATSAVTSAKIADGTIVNADIGSAAAIAGTKVAPNFGAQNIVTTGSVGIGTTGPSAAKLQVESSNVTVARFQGTVSDGWVEIYGTGPNNSGLQIGTDLTDRIQLDGAPNANSWFNTGGNVGIGTTSPTTQLYLYKSTLPWMSFGSGRSANGDEIAAIGFNALDSTSAVTTYANIVSEISNSTNGVEEGVINFETLSGGVNADRMTIKGGNVGIGTTSPGNKLHVYDNSTNWAANLQQVNSGGHGLLIKTAGAGTNYALDIETAGVDRFTVMQNGSIGIGGVTTPGSAVDMVGALTLRSMTQPALAPTGQGRLYYDMTTNKFRVSQNGGAYADLLGGGSSQWTTSGSNIYYTTGNVGIGTPSPISPLTIKTVGTYSLLIKNTADTNTLFEVMEAADGSGFLDLMDPAGAGLGVRLRAKGNSFILGNVGIGTINPQNPLHVSSYNSPQVVAFGDSNGGFVASDRTNANVGGSGFMFRSGGSTRGYITLPPNDDNTISFASPTNTSIMNVKLDTGNVGIGTTPSHKLHLRSGVFGLDDYGYISSLRQLANNYTNLFLGGAIYDNNNGTYTVKGDGGSNYWAAIRMDNEGGNAGAIRFYSRPSISGADYTLTNAQLQTYAVMNLIGGNVGIGTTSPEAKLDVRGTISSGGNDFFLGKYDGRNQGTNTANRALVHSDWGIGTDNLVINFDGDFEGGVQIMGPKTVIDGSVGIGTTDPGAYKLAVKGKIHAEEVVVDTGWADFVFDKDYDLMPLEKVAQKIEEDGHLPGIPTAQEVKENGISVGQIQSKLLQKIEEMTLYVIELKKDSELLKKENEALKERISSLENKSM